MHDPRNKKLADVFLDHSLKVKKYDKLVISTSDLQHEDLIRECYKGALKRGAYVYVDVMGMNFLVGRTSSCDLVKTFYEYAQDHQLDQIPKIYDDIVAWGDKFLRITAVENTNHLAEVDAKKMSRRMKAYQNVFHTLINKVWVLTYVPTIGFAQNARMSLSDLTDYYYESVLVDYKRMERDLRGITQAVNRGKTVHIIGYRTDLRLGIAGRTAQPCFGEKNIPDGETFTGPEEDKTEGHIYYDFPGLYMGKIITGIYLEFKQGKVVKFSAETNEQALKDILATDPGALRFGEFAIGVNYGVKRFMYNTLFDEKIGGTIHTALGRSYEDKIGWGKNTSAIHWDIVKDMRKKGSEVWIDKTLVLKDGKILV